MKDRVLRLLADSPERLFTAREVASELAESCPQVQLALAALTHECEAARVGGASGVRWRVAPLASVVLKQEGERVRARIAEIDALLASPEGVESLERHRQGLPTHGRTPMGKVKLAMGSAIELVSSYLAEHGPATEKEISAALDLLPGSVHTVLYRFRGSRFDVVKKVGGGRTPGRAQHVWALAGTVGLDVAKAKALAAQVRENEEFFKEHMDTARDDEAYEALWKNEALALKLADQLDLALAAIDKLLKRQEPSHEARAHADCRM